MEISVVISYPFATLVPPVPLRAKTPLQASDWSRWPGDRLHLDPSMVSAEENHGKTMGKPRENHGKPWENHGKTMENHRKLWENHGKMEVYPLVVTVTICELEAMAKMTWVFPINMVIFYSYVKLPEGYVKIAIETCPVEMTWVFPWIAWWCSVVMWLVSRG